MKVTIDEDSTDKQTTSPVGGWVGERESEGDGGERERKRDEQAIAQLIYLAE